MSFHTGPLFECCCGLESRAHLATTKAEPPLSGHYSKTGPPTPFSGSGPDADSEPYP